MFTKPHGAPLAQSEQKKDLTVASKVATAVRAMMHSNKLHLPADYSAENALKSAWLVLQDVKDKDQRPVLQACDHASIYNSLLDMVVQGLNPAKKQCYFIAYGKMLTCLRSYFGDMALARRVMPGIEIYAEVVYEGDDFAYSILNGRKIITKHEQKIENRIGANIQAAYCGVLGANGENLGAVIMSMDEIKKSWSKSKTYASGKGTHFDFPEAMALRTVVRKRCKPIINSSSDAVLLEAVQREEIASAEAEADEQAFAQANAAVIDIDGKDALEEVSATGETPAEMAAATGPADLPAGHPYLQQ